MPDLYLGERRPRGRLLYLLALLFALLIGSRYIASTVIDYSWWSEVGQLDTWFNLLLYGTVPVLLTILLFWIAFSVAFKLGRRHGGDQPLFGVLKQSLVSKLAYLLFFFVALIAANATVDNWTVVRFFGGQRVPSSAQEFVDPIFNKPLHFYFFGLPFYNMILHVVITGTVLVLLIYWLASNAENLGRSFPTMTPGGGFDFEYQSRSIRDAFRSNFVRLAGAVLLLGMALKFYFNRYGLLVEDHWAVSGGGGLGS